jgi:predicted permease
MPELGRYARELRALLWKPSVAHEVQAELDHHLEQLEAELVARGVAPAEARAQARARFGDPTRIGAECREIGRARDRERRRARWLDELRQDGRYALRQLRASPRFTLVAVATLAIGLGAATTIFGIADAVLLRPLPFPAPDRLAVAWEQTPSGQPFSVSEPNYLDWEARVRRLARVAAFAMRSPNLMSDAGPEQLVGAAVTHGFFPVLGVAPALGRTFSPEETTPGADARVAVLGDALWRRHFAGDPQVLERTVQLDGTRYRVVGVMPRGFDFPGDTEVWLPLAPSPSWPRADRRLEAMVGRLAPGATRAHAQRELADVAAALARDYPASNADWGARLRPLTEWYVSETVRARVVTLLAAVGLLLAMACANVASLLLARASTRERPMAVRAALGAGRGRLVRQLLTESVLLALLGGAAGVALAAAAVPLVRRTGSAAVPLLATMRLDWRVLGFALAACVATGLVFGLAPALRLARAAAPGGRRGARAGATLHALLRSGTRVAESGRLRAALIVGSVALATGMLVSAGLVGGSFVRLMRIDLGFASEQVLTGSIVLPEERYQPAQVVAFFDQLTERLAALPGVRAVGATNIAPYGGGNTAMGWAAAGREPANRSEYPIASWRAVTGGYFAALGITLRQGRLYEPADFGVPRGVPRPLVISETLARRAWPGEQSVIDRQLKLGNGQTARVIGVVSDARLLSVDSAPAPTIYFPQARFAFPSMWLTVRAGCPPRAGGCDLAALQGAVRREVAALDPALPVARLQPLTQLVRDATAQPRLTVLVFAIFAAAAVALAAVGLYGLIAFGVAQRTREIGVQLALGARPARVVRGVLAQGVRLALLGVALGAVGAYAAAGALRAILFETEPTDPATYAAVAVLLVLVAALASAAPARRAARLDPVAALRGD